MRIIQALWGEQIKVDDKYYWWLLGLGPWRLNAYGYAVSSGRYMHRLIFAREHGYMPKEIDHKNKDQLDNWIKNLRACTRSQNNANGNMGRGGSSIYRGVRWFRRDENWHARIKKNGIEYHLGYFDSEIEAARAYDRKAIEFYSEFATLNFPRSDYENHQ